MFGMNLNVLKRLGRERAALEAVVETIDEMDSGCEDIEGLVELAR